MSSAIVPTVNSEAALRAMRAVCSPTDLEPELSWIRISNIHALVAEARFVQALFQHCVDVRPEAVLEDVYYVGYLSREDAKEEANMYRDNITLFQKTWSIQQEFFELNILADVAARVARDSEPSGQPPAADDREAGLHRRFIDYAIRPGQNVKIIVIGVDIRVPSAVVQLLFEITGRVRRHGILVNVRTGIFDGLVQVEHERPEDAIDAVRILNGNVTFFGKTWNMRAWTYYSYNQWL